MVTLETLRLAEGASGVQVNEKVHVAVCPVLSGRDPAEHTNISGA